MSFQRMMLAHVASRLNRHGQTRIVDGLTLELDGVAVLRASEVSEGSSAASLTALCLARVTPATERSAA